jgi:hypothetical protein
MNGDDSFSYKDVGNFSCGYTNVSSFSGLSWKILKNMGNSQNPWPGTPLA